MEIIEETPDGEYTTVRMTESSITIQLPTGMHISVYADGSVEAIDQNGNIKSMGSA
jgi:hypothetical protein